MKKLKGRSLSDHLASTSKNLDNKREERIDAMRVKAGLYKKKYEELLADFDRLRSDFDMLVDISKISEDYIHMEPSRKVKGGESTAVAVLSDVHAFEVVRPDEVNGLNEHNKDICSKSLKTFFNKVALLTDIESKEANVNKLILGLLGDLMTNQLHIDQVETNDGTPQEEIMFLRSHLISGIDYLLDSLDIKEIVVPCADGNHGRDTDRTRAANRVKHSHEWLLYCLLADHYAGNKRVRFSIANGMLHYLDLYGRTTRWTHGDGIRYQGGVGGLTIPARKAVAGWDKGREAAFTFFGHHHTTHLDKVFASNGSSLGYNAYAVSIKAVYEPPQQGFFVFNERRWLDCFRPIYVRDF